MMTRSPTMVTLSNRPECVAMVSLLLLMSANDKFELHTHHAHMYTYVDPKCSKHLYMYMCCLSLKIGTYDCLCLTQHSICTGTDFYCGAVKFG